MNLRAEEGKNTGKRKVKKRKGKETGKGKEEVVNREKGKKNFKRNLSEKK